jgi:hypothetical protein
MHSMTQPTRRIPASQAVVHSSITEKQHRQQNISEAWARVNKGQQAGEALENDMATLAQEACPLMPSLAVQAQQQLHGMSQEQYDQVVQYGHAQVDTGTLSHELELGRYFGMEKMRACKQMASNVSGSNKQADARIWPGGGNSGQGPTDVTARSIKQKGTGFAEAGMSSAIGEGPYEFIAWLQAEPTVARQHVAYMVYNPRPAAGFCNAYDLLIVEPHDTPAREHFTASVYGISHIIHRPPALYSAVGGAVVDLLPFAQWDRERFIFNRLVAMPFFKQYPLCKSFFCWSVHVRREKHKRLAFYLEQQLLPSIPGLRVALQQLNDLCVDMVRVPLLHMPPLASFMHNRFLHEQRAYHRGSSASGLQARLQALLAEMVQVICKGCDEVVRLYGAQEADGEEEDELVRADGLSRVTGMSTEELTKRLWREEQLQDKERRTKRDRQERVHNGTSSTPVDADQPAGSKPQEEDNLVESAVAFYSAGGAARHEYTHAMKAARLRVLRRLSQFIRVADLMATEAMIQMAVQGLCALEDRLAGAGPTMHEGQEEDPAWHAWFAEQADTSRKLLLSRVEATKGAGEESGIVRRMSAMSAEVEGGDKDEDEDEDEVKDDDPGVDPWVIDAPLVPSICVGFDVQSGQDTLRRLFVPGKEREMGFSYLLVDDTVGGQDAEEGEEMSEEIEGWADGEVAATAVQSAEKEGTKHRSHRRRRRRRHNKQHANFDCGNHQNSSRYDVANDADPDEADDAGAGGGVDGAEEETPVVWSEDQPDAAVSAIEAMARRNEALMDTLSKQIARPRYREEEERKERERVAAAAAVAVAAEMAVTAAAAARIAAASPHDPQFDQLLLNIVEVSLHCARHRERKSVRASVRCGYQRYSTDCTRLKQTMFGSHKSSMKRQKASVLASGTWGDETFVMEAAPEEARKGDEELENDHMYCMLVSDDNDGLIDDEVVGHVLVPFDWEWLDMESIKRDGEEAIRKHEARLAGTDQDEDALPEVTVDAGSHKSKVVVAAMREMAAEQLHRGCSTGSTVQGSTPQGPKVECWLPLYGYAHGEGTTEGDDDEDPNEGDVVGRLRVCLQWVNRTFTAKVLQQVELESTGLKLDQGTKVMAVDSQHTIRLQAAQLPDPVFFCQVRAEADENWESKVRGRQQLSYLLQKREGGAHWKDTCVGDVNDEEEHVYENAAHQKARHAGILLEHQMSRGFSKTNKGKAKGGKHWSAEAEAEERKRKQRLAARAKLHEERMKFMERNMEDVPEDHLPKVLIEPKKEVTAAAEATLAGSSVASLKESGESELTKEPGKVPHQCYCEWMQAIRNVLDDAVNTLDEARHWGIHQAEGKAGADTSRGRGLLQHPRLQQHAAMRIYALIRDKQNSSRSNGGSLATVLQQHPPFTATMRRVEQLVEQSYLRLQDAAAEVAPLMQLLSPEYQLRPHSLRIRYPSAATVRRIEEQAHAVGTRCCPPPPLPLAECVMPELYADSIRKWEALVIDLRAMMVPLQFGPFVLDLAPLVRRILPVAERAVVQLRVLLPRVARQWYALVNSEVQRCAKMLARTPATIEECARWAEFAQSMVPSHAARQALEERVGRAERLAELQVMLDRMELTGVEEKDDDDGADGTTDGDKKKDRNENVAVVSMLGVLKQSRQDLVSAVGIAQQVTSTHLEHFNGVLEREMRELAADAFELLRQSHSHLFTTASASLMPPSPSDSKAIMVKSNGDEGGQVTVAIPVEERVAGLRALVDGLHQLQAREDHYRYVERLFGADPLAMPLALVGRRLKALTELWDEIKSWREMRTAWGSMAVLKLPTRSMMDGSAVRELLNALDTIESHIAEAFVEYLDAEADGRYSHPDAENAEGAGYESKEAKRVRREAEEADALTIEGRKRRAKLEEEKRAKLLQQLEAVHSVRAEAKLLAFYIAGPATQLRTTSIVPAQHWEHDMCRGCIGLRCMFGIGMAPAAGTVELGSITLQMLLRRLRRSPKRIIDCRLTSATAVVDSTISKTLDKIKHQAEALLLQIIDAAPLEISHTGTDSGNTSSSDGVRKRRKSTSIGSSFILVRCEEVEATLVDLQLRVCSLLHPLNPQQGSTNALSKRLLGAIQVLNDWQIAQRQYMHLRASAHCLSKSDSTFSQRFEAASLQWRKLMQETMAFPGVLQAVESIGTAEKIRTLCAQTAVLLERVRAQLDAIRAQTPRLFFVSDETLLHLLELADNEESVLEAVAASGCFGGVRRLLYTCYRADDKNKEARAALPTLKPSQYTANAREILKLLEGSMGSNGANDEDLSGLNHSQPHTKLSLLVSLLLRDCPGSTRRSKNWLSKGRGGVSMAMQMFVGVMKNTGTQGQPEPQRGGQSPQVEVGGSDAKAAAATTAARTPPEVEFPAGLHADTATPAQEKPYTGDRSSLSDTDSLLHKHQEAQAEKEVAAKAKVSFGDSTVLSMDNNNIWATGSAQTGGDGGDGTWLVLGAEGLDGGALPLKVVLPLAMISTKAGKKLNLKWWTQLERALATSVNEHRQLAFVAALEWWYSHANSGNVGKVIAKDPTSEAPLPYWAFRCVPQATITAMLQLFSHEVERIIHQGANKREGLQALQEKLAFETQCVMRALRTGRAPALNAQKPKAQAEASVNKPLTSAQFLVLQSLVMLLTQQQSLVGQLIKEMGAAAEDPYALQWSWHGRMWHGWASPRNYRSAVPRSTSAETTSTSTGSTNNNDEGGSHAALTAALRSLEWSGGAGYVQIAGVQAQYGDEFVSAMEPTSTRLVVTPLTERCCLALLFAIKSANEGARRAHICHLNAPSGVRPQELVEGLAGTCSRLLRPFHFSSSTSIEQTGRLFAGLALTRGWCSMHSLETCSDSQLSSMVQQLSVLHEAISTVHANMEAAAAKNSRRSQRDRTEAVNPKSGQMRVKRQSSNNSIQGDTVTGLSGISTPIDFVASCSSRRQLHCSSFGWPIPSIEPRFVLFSLSSPLPAARPKPLPSHLRAMLRTVVVPMPEPEMLLRFALLREGFKADEPTAQSGFTRLLHEIQLAICCSPIDLLGVVPMHGLKGNAAVMSAVGTGDEGDSRVVRLLQGSIKVAGVLMRHGGSSPPAESVSMAVQARYLRQGIMRHVAPGIPPQCLKYFEQLIERCFARLPEVSEEQDGTLDDSVVEIDDESTGPVEPEMREAIVRVLREQKSGGPLQVNEPQVASMMSLMHALQSNGSAILTGGPGCGKSTVVKTLALALGQVDVRHVSPKSLSLDALYGKPNMDPMTNQVFPWTEGLLAKLLRPRARGGALPDMGNQVRWVVLDGPLRNEQWAEKLHQLREQYQGHASSKLLFETISQLHHTPATLADAALVHVRDPDRHPEDVVGSAHLEAATKARRAGEEEVYEMAMAEESIRLQKRHPRLASWLESCIPAEWHDVERQWTKKHVPFSLHVALRLRMQVVGGARHTEHSISMQQAIDPTDSQLVDSTVTIFIALMRVGEARWPRMLDRGEMLDALEGCLILAVVWGVGGDLTGLQSEKFEEEWQKACVMLGLVSGQTEGRRGGRVVGWSLYRTAYEWDEMELLNLDLPTVGGRPLLGGAGVGPKGDGALFPALERMCGSSPCSSIHEMGAELRTIEVATADRLGYLMVLMSLLRARVPVLLLGEVDAGKTMLMRSAFDLLADAITDGEQKRGLLEMCARQGRQHFQQLSLSATRAQIQAAAQATGSTTKYASQFVPPQVSLAGLIFVDDLHQEPMECAGSTIDPLRQVLDKCAFHYCSGDVGGAGVARGRYRWTQLPGVWYCAAMQPRFLLGESKGVFEPAAQEAAETMRLVRHFIPLRVHPLDAANTETIFTVLFERALGFRNTGSDRTSGMGGSIIDDEHRSLLLGIVRANVQLYHVAKVELLPTPAQPHYAYSCADLRKLFSGVLQFGVPRLLAAKGSTVRALWAHEAQRQFADRLWNDRHRQTMDHFIAVLAAKHLSSGQQTSFDVTALSEQTSSTIFGSFLLPAVRSDDTPNDEKAPPPLNKTTKSTAVEVEKAATVGTEKAAERESVETTKAGAKDGVVPAVCSLGSEAATRLINESVMQPLEDIIGGHCAVTTDVHDNSGEFSPEAIIAFLQQGRPGLRRKQLLCPIEPMTDAQDPLMGEALLSERPDILAQAAVRAQQREAALQAARRKGLKREHEYKKIALDGPELAGFLQHELDATNKAQEAGAVPLARLDLVLIKEVVVHLVRILRVLNAGCAPPPGQSASATSVEHLLLLGGGGAGRKCLTRFACRLLGQAVVEVPVELLAQPGSSAEATTAGAQGAYDGIPWTEEHGTMAEDRKSESSSSSPWHTLLFETMLAAGFERRDVTLVIPDVHNACPEVLADIDDLLAGRMIIGLYDGARRGLVEQAERAACPFAFTPTSNDDKGGRTEPLLDSFHRRARKHLRLVLSSNARPGDPRLRLLFRSIACLRTRCTINWIDGWSVGTLFSVAEKRVRSIFEGHRREYRDRVSEQRYRNREMVLFSLRRAVKNMALLKQENPAEQSDPVLNASASATKKGGKKKAKSKGKKKKRKSLDAEVAEKEKEEKVKEEKDKKEKEKKMEEKRTKAEEISTPQHKRIDESALLEHVGSWWLRLTAEQLCVLSSSVAQLMTEIYLSVQEGAYKVESHSNDSSIPGENANAVGCSGEEEDEEEEDDYEEVAAATTLAAAAASGGGGIASAAGIGPGPDAGDFVHATASAAAAATAAANHGARSATGRWHVGMLATPRMLLDMGQVFASMLVGWQEEWVQNSMRIYRGLHQLRVLREHFRHIVNNFNDLKRRLQLEEETHSALQEAIMFAIEDLNAMEHSRMLQNHRYLRMLKAAQKMKAMAEGGVLSAQAEFKHWRENVAVLSKDVNNIAELAGVRPGGFLKSAEATSALPAGIKELLLYLSLAKKQTGDIPVATSKDGEEGANDKVKKGEENGGSGEKAENAEETVPESAECVRFSDWLSPTLLEFKEAAEDSVGYHPSLNDGSKVLMDAGLHNWLTSFDLAHMSRQLYERAVAFVANPDCAPEVLEEYEPAAGVIGRWITSMVRLRQQIEQAQPELEAARMQQLHADDEAEALKAFDAPLVLRIDALSEVESQCECSVETIVELKTAMQRGSSTRRAQEMLGLQSRLQQRWQTELNRLKLLPQRSIGPLVLAAAAVSFLGGCTEQERSRLSVGWKTAALRLGLEVDPTLLRYHKQEWADASRTNTPQDADPNSNRPRTPPLLQELLEGGGMEGGDEDGENDEDQIDEAEGASEEERARRKAKRRARKQAETDGEGGLWHMQLRGGDPLLRSDELSLVDPLTRQRWVEQYELPRGNYCQQSAAIACTSMRCPLLLDPHGEIKKWAVEGLDRKGADFTDALFESSSSAVASEGQGRKRRLAHHCMKRGELAARNAIITSEAVAHASAAVFYWRESSKDRMVGGKGAEPIEVTEAAQQPKKKQHGTAFLHKEKMNKYFHGHSHSHYHYDPKGAQDTGGAEERQKVVFVRLGGQHNATTFDTLQTAAEHGHMAVVDITDSAQLAGSRLLPFLTPMHELPVDVEGRRVMVLRRRQVLVKMDDAYLENLSAADRGADVGHDPGDKEDDQEDEEDKKRLAADKGTFTRQKSQKKLGALRKRMKTVTGKITQINRTVTKLGANQTIFMTKVVVEYDSIFVHPDFRIAVMSRTATPPSDLPKSVLSRLHVVNFAAPQAGAEAEARLLETISRARDEQGHDQWHAQSRSIWQLSREMQVAESQIYLELCGNRRTAVDYTTAHSKDDLHKRRVNHEEMLKQAAANNSAGQPRYQQHRGSMPVGGPVNKHTLLVDIVKDPHTLAGSMIKVNDATYGSLEFVVLHKRLHETRRKLEQRMVRQQSLTGKRALYRPAARRAVLMYHALCCSFRLNPLYLCSFGHYEEVLLQLLPQGEEQVPNAPSSPLSRVHGAQQPAPTHLPVSKEGSKEGIDAFRAQTRAVFSPKRSNAASPTAGRKSKSPDVISLTRIKTRMTSLRKRRDKGSGAIVPSPQQVEVCTARILAHFSRGMLPAHASAFGMVLWGVLEAEKLTSEKGRGGGRRNTARQWQQQWHFLLHAGHAEKDAALQQQIHDARLGWLGRAAIVAKISNEMLGEATTRWRQKLGREWLDEVHIGKTSFSPPRSPSANVSPANSHSNPSQFYKMSLSPSKFVTDADTLASRSATDEVRQLVDAMVEDAETADTVSKELHTKALKFVEKETKGQMKRATDAASTMRRRSVVELEQQAKQVTGPGKGGKKLWAKLQLKSNLGSKLLMNRKVKKSSRMRLIEERAHFLYKKTRTKTLALVNLQSGLGTGELPAPKAVTADPSFDARASSKSFARRSTTLKRQSNVARFTIRSKPDRKGRGAGGLAGAFSAAVDVMGTHKEESEGAEEVKAWCYNDSRWLDQNMLTSLRKLEEVSPQKLGSMWVRVQRDEVLWRRALREVSIEQQPIGQAAFPWSEVYGDTSSVAVGSWDWLLLVRCLHPESLMEAVGTYVDLKQTDALAKEAVAVQLPSATGAEDTEELLAWAAEQATDTRPVLVVTSENHNPFPELQACARNMYGVGVSTGDTRGMGATGLSWRVPVLPHSCDGQDYPPKPPPTAALRLTTASPKHRSSRSTPAADEVSLSVAKSWWKKTAEKNVDANKTATELLRTSRAAAQWVVLSSAHVLPGDPVTAHYQALKDSNECRRMSFSSMMSAASASKAAKQSRTWILGDTEELAMLPQQLRANAIKTTAVKGPPHYTQCVTGQLRRMRHEHLQRHGSDVINYAQRAQLLCGIVHFHVALQHRARLLPSPGAVHVLDQEHLRQALLQGIKFDAALFDAQTKHAESVRQGGTRTEGVQQPMLRALQQLVVGTSHGAAAGPSAGPFERRLLEAFGRRYLGCALLSTEGGQRFTSDGTYVLPVERGSTSKFSKGDAIEDAKGLSRKIRAKHGKGGSASSPKKGARRQTGTMHTKREPDAEGGSAEQVGTKLFVLDQPAETTDNQCREGCETYPEYLARLPQQYDQMSLLGFPQSMAISAKRVEAQTLIEHLRAMIDDRSTNSTDTSSWVRLGLPSERSPTLDAISGGHSVADAERLALMKLQEAHDVITAELERLPPQFKDTTDANDRECAWTGLGLRGDFDALLEAEDCDDPVELAVRRELACLRQRLRSIGQLIGGLQLGSSGLVGNVVVPASAVELIEVLMNDYAPLEWHPVAHACQIYGRMGTEAGVCSFETWSNAVRACVHQHRQWARMQGGSIDEAAPVVYAAPCLRWPAMLLQAVLQRHGLRTGILLSDLTLVLEPITASAKELEQGGVRMAGLRLQGAMLSSNFKLATLPPNSAAVVQPLPIVRLVPVPLADVQASPASFHECPLFQRWNAHSSSTTTIASVSGGGSYIQPTDRTACLTSVYLRKPRGLDTDTLTLAGTAVVINSDDLQDVADAAQ